MNHQLVGRNSKSKGVKVKHAIQITILMVLGLWMLCQLKNSRFNPLEMKLKDGSIDLGRKGNPGIDEGNPMIQHRNEEDGESGDDESDRKAEEEASKLEASLKEVLTREAKEEEKLENREKEILAHVEGEQENDQRDHEKITEEKVTEEESEDATDDEEKDPKELESNVEVKTEESKDNAEETEGTKGVDGYNDENGIPPDSLILQDGAAKEKTDDSAARRMDEETVVNSINQTEDGTSTLTDDNSIKSNSRNKSEIPVDDFDRLKFEVWSEFDDKSGPTMVRSSENNAEVPEVDTNDHEDVEEVFEAENAEKLEKLRINGTAELTEEDGIVFEGSDSGLSQHEVQESEE